VITDAALDEVRSRGFVVVEGFLRGDELRAAQEALWDEFPTPDDHFADPDAEPWVNEHQFSGLRRGPVRSLAINRIAHHPDLIDAAERFCGSTDIQLYKTELWAKYSGGADYDQQLHRDFGNHNLVVPRADGRWPQMTTFVYLSDVTEEDGPTVAVPRTHTDHIARSVHFLERGDFRADEVAAVGSAGSLLVYTTDVFHRGSSMTGERRARFSFLADYMGRGAAWLGRIAWPDSALMSDVWDATLGDCTPRQREIYGFPPVGHEYWNEQTVRDTGVRWPSVDMAPYEAGPSR
jgi:hypothetical protein